MQRQTFSAGTRTYPLCNLKCCSKREFSIVQASCVAIHSTELANDALCRCTVIRPMLHGDIMHHARARARSRGAHDCDSTQRARNAVAAEQHRPSLSSRIWRGMLGSLASSPPLTTYWCLRTAGLPRTSAYQQPFTGVAPRVLQSIFGSVLQTSRPCGRGDVQHVLPLQTKLNVENNDNKN